MLNQPTSSPMMKTMFGFFADEASWAWAAIAVVVALAMASNLPLFRPSEQVACAAASPAMVCRQSVGAGRSFNAGTDRRGGIPQASTRRHEQQHRDPESIHTADSPRRSCGDAIMEQRLTDEF